MPVRGLTIIVTDVDETRFRAALSMAMAQAALEGTARVFLDGSSVSMIRQPVIGRDDKIQAGAGLPTLAQLLDEALAQGVHVILCQTGLQMTGGQASDYDGRVEYGGLVSVMAGLGDDRLVTV